MRTLRFNSVPIAAAFALMASVVGLAVFASLAQAAPQSSSVVVIQKYIDGVPATSANASSSSFAMNATWDADNLGEGSGSFTLDSGNGYIATTSQMDNGADYSTSEVMNNTVGATCEAGKPFALLGYTKGGTLAEAQAAEKSMNPPHFNNIQHDKYVIVWNHDCSKQTPPEPTSPVKVTIVKYVNGAHATANNAGTSTFPFIADYNATSSGNHIQGSDPYTIGPSGNNTANPYEAVTLDFAPGAMYGTHEVTGGNTVGASCSDGKPFALSGYTTGNTLAEAQNATATTTAPSFSNLQGNKYVIVWNQACAQQPATSTVKVTIVKFIDGSQAGTSTASSSSFTMNASWNAANIGAGSGTFTLGPNGFNTANPYQAVTADMTSGASYSLNEATTTAPVGASCQSGQRFTLNGYTTGNTLAAAMAATATTTAPNLTNIQSNKYIIVWNHDCNATTTNGVLHVDSIDATKTNATADNSYENGWRYVFHITDPNNEPNVAMKFSDWFSGSSTIPAANNIRLSSAQASNPGPITITAANLYSSPDFHMVTDLNPSMPGRQVDIVVEVKIPIGTSNGTYTTTYGVRSLP